MLTNPLWKAVPRLGYTGYLLLSSLMWLPQYTFSAPNPRVPLSQSTNIRNLGTRWLRLKHLQESFGEKYYITMLDWMSKYTKHSSYTCCIMKHICVAIKCMFCLVGVQYGVSCFCVLCCACPVLFLGWCLYMYCIWSWYMYMFENCI